MQCVRRTRKAHRASRSVISKEAPRHTVLHRSAWRRLRNLLSEARGRFNATDPADGPFPSASPRRSLPLLDPRGARPTRRFRGSTARRESRASATRFLSRRRILEQRPGSPRRLLRHDRAAARAMASPPFAQLIRPSPVAQVHRAPHTAWPPSPRRRTLRFSSGEFIHSLQRADGTLPDRIHSLQRADGTLPDRIHSLRGRTARYGIRLSTTSSTGIRNVPRRLRVTGTLSPAPRAAPLPPWSRRPAPCARRPSAASSSRRGAPRRASPGAARGA
jgi:hypothetical protein